MKALLALVGGFVISLAMFVGGAGLAIFLLAVPEKQGGLEENIASSWAMEPQVVKSASRSEPVFPDSEGDTLSDRGDTPPDNAAGAGSTDTVTTSSVSDSDLEDNQLSQALEDHVTWCMDHYRSYNLRDNTYKPYGGRRRHCISPYTDAISVPREAREPAEYENGQEVEFIGDEGKTWDQAAVEFAVDYGPDQKHISFCSSRYRSYREEDNTYQPYGGGPRRRCVRD